MAATNHATIACSYMSQSSPTLQRREAIHGDPEKCIATPLSGINLALLYLVGRTGAVVVPLA